MNLLRIFGLARLPRRPKGHPPFAFHDQNGVSHYAWEDPSQLPPQRMAEVEAIMLQIDAGLSAKELTTISKVLVEHIDAAVMEKDRKAQQGPLSKAKFLAMELLSRPTRVIPEDAYYALASVCCCRKDEDPYTVDRTIHYHKIETFKAAGRAGLAFFTQSPTFRAYLGALLGTEAALVDLLIGWAQERARMDQAMKIASSTTD